jgi:hypothetical protein
LVILPIFLNFKANFLGLKTPTPLKIKKELEKKPIYFDKTKLQVRFYKWLATHRIFSKNMEFTKLIINRCPDEFYRFVVWATFSSFQEHQKDNLEHAKDILRSYLDL